MKTLGVGAAFNTAIFHAAVVAVVAVGTFSAAAIRPAAAAECTGPFRECAIGAKARCTRDRDGQQLMTYWDNPGNVYLFERCVGRIFEAAGQPDPYKTPAASATGRTRRGGHLTIPRSNLLYPTGRP
jgi:hypothetical protein